MCKLLLNIFVDLYYKNNFNQMKCLETRVLKCTKDNIISCKLLLCYSYIQFVYSFELLYILVINVLIVFFYVLN